MPGVHYSPSMLSAAEVAVLEPGKHPTEGPRLGLEEPRHWHYRETLCSFYGYCVGKAEEEGLWPASQTYRVNSAK